MKFSQYLEPSLVTFMEVNSSEEAIATLVELCYHAGKLQDRDIFYRAVMNREKIMSTAIGMNVAVPHAKLPGYRNFFIAVGIVRKGLDWNAIDGFPVKLVFLIGGSDEKQTEYLQILSELTRAVKDENIRKKMLTLNSPEDIIQLFKE